VPHTFRVIRTVQSLVVLAPLLLLGVGSAAGAIDYTDRDPRGDVEGWDWNPDPKPCGTSEQVEPEDGRKGDIRRLSVRTEDGVLKFRLRFRDMPALRRLYITFPVRTRDRDFTIDVFRVRKRTHVHLLREKPLPEPEPGVECYAVLLDAGSKSCKNLGASLSPRTDRARVRLPITCMGDPRWVRVGADASYNTDGASFSDTWAPPGSTPEGSWGHVYGPRVRIGR
jgi:hypothetical protein